MSNTHKFRASATIEVLQKRAEILQRIRRFFDGRDFFEVQTPTLSSETVIDVYLDPIRVKGAELQLPLEESKQEFYLQTSPEFAMKRLVASGAEAIYQICPAFRSGEQGRLHNPEFTILEWYRTGDSFEDGIQLLGEFVNQIAEREQWNTLTYQDAFRRYAGFDPLEVSNEQLAEAARRMELSIDGSLMQSVDEWLNLIFDNSIVPHLGVDCPTILTHYPRSQAALAQISKDDSRTAERFELFIDGIELANGYGELLDDEELALRSRENNRQRRQLNKPEFVEPRLLQGAMLSGLPQCSGCALGLDRLIMVLLGESDIRSTLAFPFDIA